MSSTKLVQLRCDSDGCARSWVGDSDHVATVRDAARSEGWRRTGGSGQGGQFKDWCPAHSGDPELEATDRRRHARREFMRGLAETWESLS